MTALVDIAVYLGAAMLAVPLFRRLGFGAVLGYLAAGMVIGPWGLGLIGDGSSTLHIGEIGVVFLLFVIGLELKPSRLWVMRRSIFVTGSAQVIVAALPLAALAVWWGLSPAVALLVGFGLSLSSTAFVLQTLAERQALGSPPGRAAFGVLLFQDLAVIPAIALLPLLGSHAVVSGSGGLWWDVLRAVAVVVGLILGGRYLLRPVFRTVARWGSEESFTVAALLVVIGAALLMQWAELSMGLGAFLAGVLLADSEYRHELEANISPFKSLLLGLFFISVGMTADFGVLAQAPGVIVLGGLALIIVKASGLWMVARGLRIPHPAAPQLALMLAQGGEFAFVLFHEAEALQLFPPQLAAQLNAMVILSMLLTPGLFILADVLGRRARAQAPPPAYDDIPDDEPPVILAGFGRVGQIVARVLQMRGLSFTALDQDAEQVELVRRFGNKVYYGEASHLETLRAAGAGRAQLLVVTLEDAARSVQTVELARRHFPHLKILASARDRQHALHLMDLGVTALVRETFHSGLALTRQLLQALGDDEEAARYTLEVFADADERLLARQLGSRSDLAQMIQTSHEVRLQLAELLENDPRMSALSTRSRQVRAAAATPGSSR